MLTIVKDYRSRVNSVVPMQFNDARISHTWLLVASHRRPTCQMTRRPTRSSPNDRPSPGSIPMTLIYPNIVPENNLRLPDALTIKHGPAPLLARFVLEADKAARAKGVQLRLRHDFGELLYVN